MSEENKENPPRKHTLDKILMGAVIGGAIGSVIGATIAPKSGKETRKEIVAAVKSTGKGSKRFFQKLKEMFSFKKNKQVSQSPQEHHSHASIKKIPNEDSADATREKKL